jgi:hypothetical protein
MIRTIEVRERPWGRDDLNYVREGRAGALFRGRDGLDVRLAAPERDAGVSRDRLSLVGVLIAFIASGVDSR